MSIEDPKYLHLRPEREPPACPFDTPYSALVIIDAEVSNDWRNRISDWLVETGCRTMMAWGHDCSLWDDAVDWTVLEKFNFEDIPDEKWVTTTWHDDEDIIDVMWYASWNIFNLNENSAEHLLIIDISISPRETDILRIYNFSRTAEIEEPLES